MTAGLSQAGLAVRFRYVSQSMEVPSLAPWIVQRSGRYWPSLLAILGHVEMVRKLWMEMESDIA